MRIFITIAVASVLCTITTPVFAATSSKYTETFTTAKFRSSTTTAVWKGGSGKVVLPKKYDQTLLTRKDGLPDMTPASVAASGDTWVIVGGRNGVAKVVRSKNGKMTDLSNKVTDDPALGLTAVGTNGTYWLFGGRNRLYKLQGDTVTNISTAYTGVLTNTQTQPSSIQWNGSYWIILQDGNVIKYDGTTFTNITSLFPDTYGPSPSNTRYLASWNGTAWLIIGYYASAAYIYDGATSTKVDIGLPAYQGIETVTNDGVHWLISWGQSNEYYYATLDANGANRTDFPAPAIKNQYGATIVWDGVHWIMTPILPSAVSTIYVLNHDGSINTKKTYSTSGGILFTSGATPTQRGWIFTGSYGDTSLPAVVIGNDGYQTGSEAQSTSIDQTTKNIESASLTADATSTSLVAIDGITVSALSASGMNSVGSKRRVLVRYYLSNNGGKNWVETNGKGKKVTFSTRGSSLRWKAVLSTNTAGSSPVLKKVAVTYTPGK